MKINKNIKIIHDNFDFLGGGERLVLALAKELNCEIYCYNLNPSLLKFINYYKVKINYKSQRNKNNFYFKLLSFYYFLLLPLKNYSKKNIIEIYSGNFSFLHSFLSKNKKIFYCHCPPKFIIYYQKSKNQYNGISKLIILFFKNLYMSNYINFINKTNCLIANSQFTKERLNKFTNKKIVTINPPNTFKLKLDNIKIKYEDYFFSNARLDKSKNVFNIVKAFEKIKDKKLIICNNGELKEDIEKYIFDKKIENIFYINYLSDDEYIKILKNCLSVIYVPSNEDYGMSIVEAFYFSKSVITFNSGYSPELVKNNYNGLILDKLEIEDFRSVITYKNLKDFKRMGKNSKKSYIRMEKDNNFFKLIKKQISYCARF